MAKCLFIDGGQLKRLMKLCRAINKSSSVPVRQLLRQFKSTSRRTLYRDLSALEDMGIKVHDNHGGYRLTKSITACKKHIADYYTGSLKRLVAANLK